MVREPRPLGSGPRLRALTNSVARSSRIEAMNVVIEPEKPTNPDVVRLLDAHLELMRATSPPDHVHALDLDGLSSESVRFFAAREGDELLGIGALRTLGHGRAEIKSMHTTSAARGRGIGRAMVDHLIATAREQGMEWLGLETGTMAEFAPARRLYEASGFAACDPFDGYTQNGFSTCMSMSLRDAGRSA